MPRLVFLHLSDIHFSGRSSTSPYELDRRLRSELEHSAREFAQEIGGVTAVIVSGDIAFSGSKSEYANASAWLTELTSKLYIPAESVWVVPGNHDVDRGRQSDQVSAALRYRLRNSSESELDALLESILSDPISAMLLFAPLENYVEFATNYGCSTSPKSCTWMVPFELGSGYELRLTGLNSALVSDREDDKTNPSCRLIVGSFQASELLRTQGVIHMTVCHHPPSWLKDGDSLASILTNNVALCLTGHEHNFGIQSPGPSVWIAAGATHPERSEAGWEPRYNFVAVELEAERLRLVITAYPCVWSTGQSRFVKDVEWGREFAKYLDPVVRLERREEDPERPINAPGEHYETEEADSKPEGKESGGVKPDEVVKVANRQRHLLHRLAALRSLERRVVALAIGISEKEYAILGSHQYVEAVIRFATDRGLLGKLWTETELAHGVEDVVDNPYTEGGGSVDSPN